MRLFLIYILLFLSKATIAQFPPAAGMAGSMALHKDSVQWVAWANSCTVQRGFLNIANPSLGTVSSGTEQDACGIAGDGGILSLGDGGIAVLQFSTPITNGNGPDFAVFENAFNNTFLELAFVEVSSDGQNFVRFPSFSNNDTSVQIGPFGASDASKIHNLAGKYRAGYGTPFDLEELKDSINIDINNISYVKIIDVVGSILPDYCSRDSRGIIINDPWSTPFNEGGFDLDAIGVIHTVSQSDVSFTDNFTPKFYPNPIQHDLIIETDKTVEYELYNLQGSLIYSGIVDSKQTLDCTNLQSGIYMLKIGNKGYQVVKM
jgi:hypothetical protein